MRRLESRARALRSEMERGRGAGALAPHPVAMEPPLHRCSGRSRETQEDLQPATAPDLGFLGVNPSGEDTFDARIAEQLLVALGPHGPLAIEVVGQGGPAVLQVAVQQDRLFPAAQQILAHYPTAEVSPREDHLAGGAQATVARLYRLRASPLLPLRSDHRTETYAALLGAMSALVQGECALLQVLFVPVRHDWRASILRVATDPWDASRSPFSDLPDLPRKAREKVSRPLFATSVRLAGSSVQVVDRLEGSFLTQFAGDENALEPCEQPYPVASVLARTAHVPGMLLNSQELAALVHLPDSKSIPHGALRKARRSAPAPDRARRDILVPLGINRHRGLEARVGIGEEWLTRHCAVFGATGSGKTNLLKHFLAVVESGYGLAFLDPAGDAAEEFLDLIPAHRANDVIYFDPTDRAWPPALNMLESTDEREREMLASELVLGLSRLFRSAWGHRLEWILRQTVRTLLLSPGEKTLRDIRRILCQEDYRQQVLSGLADPDLQEFWEQSFPRLSKRGAIDTILNKLSRFLDNPLVRNIVSQKGGIDFGALLQEGKILICNLSKGKLTEEASVVLGSFVLSRLQIASLARTNIPPRDRRLFTIVVDETHNYTGKDSDTASVRTFLSEARKYRVALVVSTQYPSQLAREAAQAVFGNVGTLICLRTGVTDAKMLQQQLGQFGQDDLLDLSVGQALVRMGEASQTFNVAIPLVPIPTDTVRETIVRQSRARYCRPRDDVEQALLRDPAPVRPVDLVFPVDLDPDERQLLLCLVRDPELTVTEAAAAAGFGGYKATRVRRSLQEGGFTAEVETRLGRGGTVAKFAIPTLKAYEALGRETPRGRGGPVHRHFQQVIAEWARRRGYRAMVEHHIEGGSVDVHLETPEGQVAVELSANLRPQRELGNLRKCLQAGYHQVICLLLDAESERQMRELTESALSEDQLERVRIGRLDRYAELI